MKTFFLIGAQKWLGQERQTYFYILHFQCFTANACSLTLITQIILL